MFEDLLRYDNTKKYCFFDLETFNLCLSFHQNRAWEFGLITMQGETILDRKVFITNWSKQTDLTCGKGAAALTGYNHEKVLREGLDPKDVWTAVEPHLNECDILIGHNILNFDIYLLKGWAEYLNRPWKHLVPKIIDTNCLIQGLKRGTPFQKGKDDLIEYQYRICNSVVKGVKSKLDLAAKEYNIEFDPTKLHSAIPDLELNIKVWNKLKYQIEI